MRHCTYGGYAIMIVNQAMRMVRVDGGGGGGGGRGAHERAGVSAGQALVAGLCTPAVRGLQEVLGHSHVQPTVGVALADQGEGRTTLRGSRQERQGRGGAQHAVPCLRTWVS
jgi:hypothetical protein